MTEEQRMLRDAARGWVARESPVAGWRALRDRGSSHDPAIWHGIVAMGWPGIALPEAVGGAGLGFASAGMVITELARTLTASPLAASVIGSSAILLGGSPAQKERWLPGIAEGRAVAVLAIDEGPHHAPEAIATRATQGKDGWELSGSKSFVAEAESATLFVVAAQTGSGIGLFVVPADAAGLSMTPRAMVDARSHGDVRLDRVALPAEAWLADGPGDVVDRVLNIARTIAAAEMLGVAEQAFAMTLDYLKVRVQFGKVIGTFQVLQHRAAETFTRIELMRSAIEGALTAIDQDAADASALATLAKTLANQTLDLVSREMIQLHGGIGMTDEHDAGLYLKRARILEASWGGSGFLRSRFAEMLGI